MNTGAPSSAVTIPKLRVKSGSVGGVGNITLTDLFDWQGGTLTSGGGSMSFSEAPGGGNATARKCT